jgi:hypothetical protein
MNTYKGIALGFFLAFSSNVSAQDAGSPALEEFTSAGEKIGVRVFFHRKAMENHEAP